MFFRSRALEPQAYHDRNASASLARSERFIPLETVKVRIIVSSPV